MGRFGKALRAKSSAVEGAGKEGTGKGVWMRAILVPWDYSFYNKIAKSSYYYTYPQQLLRMSHDNWHLLSIDAVLDRFFVHAILPTYF